MAAVLPLSFLASAFAQTNETGTALAQDSQAIIRRGSQPSRQGPGENFTGVMRVDPLFQANAPTRMSGALVTFEPGARNGVAHTPFGPSPYRDGSEALARSRAEQFHGARRHRGAARR
jgi:4-carboxymuconolactone decarboxylase